MHIKQKVAYRENISDEHADIVFFNVRPNLSKPILERNEGQNSITFMHLEEIDKSSGDWTGIRKAIGTPGEVMRIMNERLRATMVPPLVTDDKKVIDAVNEAVEGLIPDFVGRYQEMIEDQQKLVQVRRNIRDEQDLQQRLASTPNYQLHSPFYFPTSPGYSRLEELSDHESEENPEKKNSPASLFSYKSDSSINFISAKEFRENVDNDFSPSGASPDFSKYLLTNTEDVPNFQYSYSTIGKSHPPFGDLGNQPSISGIVNPSFTMNEQPPTSSVEEDINWTRNYVRDLSIMNNSPGDNSTLNNLMNIFNDEEYCPMDIDERNISFNFMTEFNDLDNLNSSNNFEEY